MFGAGVGELNVYSVNNSGSQAELWSKSGDQGNIWLRGLVPFTSDAEFRIQIEAIFLIDFNGDIAIDDVDIEMVPCSQLTTAAPIQSTTPTPAPVISVCTFETDLCDFSQDDTDDDFDWIRASGSTPTAGTGPQVDHTLTNTNGYYVYVKADGQLLGEHGSLLSVPMATGSSGLCVTWWYHMNGPDVNRLEVYAQRSGGGGDEMVWTRDGDQGSEWMMAQIHVTGDFTAKFTGVVGNGVRGDIALDDVTFSSGQCPPSTSCDFEHGDLCGFQQDVTDDGDWTLATGASTTLVYGPDVDNTYQSAQGNFLYVDNIQNAPNDKVRLISPIYPSTYQRCIRFWFYHAGTVASDLRVSLNVGGVPVQYLVDGGVPLMGNLWTVLEASFSSALDYTIVFEATVSQDGILALDDLDLTKDTCSPSGSCDFESDTCTYVNIPSNWLGLQGTNIDQFDWLRHSGSTLSSGTGPSKDHTLGTPLGYYMYIDSAQPRLADDSALFMSETIFTQGDMCLSFWYHLYGTGALTAWVRAGYDLSDWSSVWTLSLDQGDTWNHALVTLVDQGGSYEIIFEGKVGAPSTSDIGLDDISLYQGACSAPTPTPPCQFYCSNGGCLTDAAQVCNFQDDCGDGSDEMNCGPCDFESGLCNYTDVSDGSFEWKIGSDATPTDNTGPSYDHTLGTSLGHYLYVDSSQGSGYSRASLMSPELHDASPSCLMEIWVHLYGTDVGSLGVFLKSGLSKTLLIYLSEDLGNQWTKIELGIGRVRGAFQIQYDATRSFDVYGDIALDDITFIGCGFPAPSAPCSSSNFQCANQVCIDSSRVCDLTDDCGDLSDESQCESYDQCDFETGICSWEQLRNDELDWFRFAGITPSSWTGPTRDHTTGLETGTYLYIETSNGKLGDRARLGSPVLLPIPQGSATRCELRFYYHMFGENINTLTVYTREIVNGPLTVLWQRSGEIGDYYERADIVLANRNPFQVIIEATRGDDVRGDIAIDDTSFSSACQFSSNPLPDVTTPAPTVPLTTLPACDPNSYQCKNGSCIDKNLRCDGTPDCPENEDEMNCGDCDFESGTCDWSSFDNGLYVWHRTAAQDAPSGRAPSVDHTLGSAAGSFVFVDSSSGTFGVTALLVSPPQLGRTGQRCEMQFYYHMLGGDAGTLLVALYDNNILDPSYVSIVGNNGNQWNMGSLSIGPRDAGQYYIRFEASPGIGFNDASQTTDIALDDISFVNCAYTDDVSCNFGAGDTSGTICGWTQDTSDIFDWVVRKGSTPSAYTGPATDHTTGDGYYAYIESSSPRLIGENARLLSGSLRSTRGQPYCLSLWFHMFGSDIGSLAVYIRDTDGSNENLIWTKSRTQANEWRNGHYTFSTTANYELVIEGVVGQSWYGDISIDDVSLSEGECPPTAECDFEIDLCDWTNVYNNDFDWSWGSGSGGMGPAVDHSTNTATGHYAYATILGQPSGSTALLASKEYSLSGSQCLGFFYHVSGQNVGSLTVYKQDDGDMFVTPSWTISGEQGDVWRSATVDISPTADNNYKIYFEAISGGATSNADIAIDDIRFHGQPCPAEGACDFERGYCGWTNDYIGDDFDWLRGNSETLSGYTGPTFDHTLQNAFGHFAFIESSSPRVYGNKAWLVSETFESTSGRCFEMWYHMYGEGTGSLRIHIRPAGAQPQLLWTETGNQGNVWKHTMMTVASSDQFWIIVEGIIGYNFTSDTAIDDVMLYDAPCGSTPAPPSTIPTFAPDSHNCDFETGLCSWTQDPGNDFDWTRVSGTTGSAGTGPAGDHTTGDSTGYYIYIETSDGNPGDTARLNSNALRSSDDSGYCMAFWFQMYGIHLGSLSIYTSSGGAEALVWTESEPRGPFWQQGQIHFTGTDSYMVIFEGVRGADFMGDIALDDIVFHQGACPTPDICDFENGACGFTQMTSDTFDWELIQANTRGTGPTIDHTYKTSYGHVMFADMTSLSSSNDYATIQTGYYDPTPTPQCMKFSYYMGTSQASVLQVFLHARSGGSTRLWAMNTVTGPDEWHVAEINYTSSESYKFQFQASSNLYQVSAGVAIDDVIISTEPCTPFGACSFENGLCTWKNEQNDDDFDWLLIKGRTPSDDTGPGVDHTLGTPYGAYVYVEATGRAEGDVTMLKSSDFLAVSTRCMEFYYHMGGDDVGTLEVQVWPDSSTSPSTKWSQAQDTGDFWRQVQITLDPILSAYSYEVLFKGTVGASYLSDISLDDVMFYDGVCSDPPTDCDFVCNDGTDKCLPTNQICDFVSQCGNGADELDCGTTCTFEVDTCRWWNAGHGTHKFIRNQGSTPDSNTGPAYDHTTLTAAGWYMYVGTTPDSGAAYAVLSSRMHRNAAATCEVRFWYHMLGDEIGNLQVWIQEQYFLMLPWFKSGNQGDRWQEGIAGLGRIPGGFNVKFQSVRNFDVLGDVAIDDVRMEGCDLPAEQSSPCASDEFRCTHNACIDSSRLCDFTDDCGDGSDEEPALCGGYDQCSFEDDFCDWTQDIYDDTDFIRKTGPSDTENYATGPYRDHTTQYTGFYLVMDSSQQGLSEGDKARLFSPAYQQVNQNTYCRFRVWYHMFGDDIGTFNIYFRVGVGAYLTSLFSKTGHSNDYWELADVEVTSDLNFQIVIEALRGDGLAGDIAIDDTSITPDCIRSPTELQPGATSPPIVTYGPCGPGKWTCSDLTCIDLELYCNYENDCPGGEDEAACGSCDFESGLCGYQDDSYGSFAWMRDQSELLQDASGFYMTVGSGNGQFNEPARLVSTVLPDTSPDCTMTFWYLYQVSTSAPLTEFYMQVINASDPADTADLWLVPSTSVATWTQATVGLGRQITSYQIKFVVVMSDDNDMIAVDDIKFDGCKVESYVPCEVQCDNLLCVPFTKKCDYSDDCTDGTDERSCDAYQRCDFEMNLCDWSQNRDDDLDWLWMTGNQGAQGGAPGVDHTLNNPSGHYLYLYTYDKDANKRARLDGLIYSRPNAGDCQMRFWYHINGANVGTLRVMTLISLSDNPQSIWSKSGPQGDAWLRGIADLEPGSKFQILIEGVAGGLDDHMSIDDISFTPGCVVSPDQTLPIKVTPSSGPNCNTGERACDDGSCLAITKFCDFRFDCDDGSDEKECPTVCSFENDMCSWEQSLNDDFDWLKHNDSDSLEYLGPDTDHTINNPDGIYYFVDGSQQSTTKSTNQFATLVSPRFSQAGRACTASLWYYSYGVDYGMLALKRKVLTDERTLMVVDSGNTVESKWMKAEIKIPKCLTDFQVLITAENHQPQPYAGGFAIDDIRFDNCAYDMYTPVTCEDTEAKCDSGQCYPMDNKCDFTRDCCMDNTDETDCSTYNRCDFESGLCDWVQMTDDDLDWNTIQASTSAYLKFDHTLDSERGSILVVNQYQQSSSGSSAQLSSFLINPVSSGCTMRFYYYMSGEDATVTIQTRTLVGGPMTERWSMSGDQGLLWNRGSLPLTSGDTFQVIFEAMKGADSNAFLALDDVSFTPGCVQSSTPLPRSTTTPPPTTLNTRVTTPDQVQTTAFTTPREQPTPAGQTSETIYIAVGVVSGILILLVFLVLAYLLVSKKRGGKKPAEEVNIPAAMESQGYDTDLNITAFAMQDIDTNMYGASGTYTSATSEKEGFSNPSYSSPVGLPFNNDTTA
ncbi:MAM and LDL-receptor class A domain-containing protein 2 [Strongylocentrotus purpuratus]|uniref:MAM domain-containing protein n=1 Tax=Strongylocentrotus purpuratus TaxID=7668 RepID=A0A7M7PFQ2_STRPU|nr:MAM and LDL-receptor class A domain-containing protein 2 [Strongylocentrotus purpuratus]